jgi:hypothetical protein
MNKRKPPKMTKAEARYVADMERDPALARLERGVGKVLQSSDYPEPLKRLIARERSMVRIKLSAAARRKLEAVSRARGIPTEKLAQKWFEQGLAKDAG